MEAPEAQRSQAVFLHALCAVAVLVALPGSALAQVEAQLQTQLSDSSSGLLQEVTVTAQRQKQSLLKIAESITSLDSSALRQFGVHSVSDLGGLAPDLSFQYGGSGKELGYGGGQELAIRGISGYDTVGLYIDDTPVPDNLDPQVVDLARIEVLEGPQGTLYGEGSMGGNIRLVTAQPDFTNQLSYSVSAGHTDGAATPDARTEVAGNLTLIPGKAAIRVVGFINHDGGFVTREIPTGSANQLQSQDNQGAVTDYGGSVTLLLKPGSDLSISPRIMAQESNSHGLPSVFAPLPQFDVDSLTLVRAANVLEGFQNKWYLPSLEIKYTVGRWTLTSSTSYFYQYLHNVEDGTEGTEELLGVAPYSLPASIFAGGVAWSQLEKNSNFYEEDRAAWSGNQYFHGIVGLFYSNEARNVQNGSANFDFPSLVTDGIWPNPLLWHTDSAARVTDSAAYGQAYFDMDRFELTLGARVFDLGEDFWYASDGFLNGGYTTTAPIHSTQDGWTPKVALSYTLDNGAMTYVTASKGFRAGGINTPVSSVCDPGLAEIGLTPAQAEKYSPDSLWNYEAGAKAHIGSVALTGSAFEMVWNGIQQNVTVPVCEFPVTLNSGQARVRGVELQVFGRPLPDLQARLSASYESPKITEAGLSGQPVGSRIFGVPYFIGSAALTYSRQITEVLNAYVSTNYSYTGNSVSNTTSALFGLPPLTRAGYGILNVKIGTEWGGKQLWLYFDNITNVRANLGDINPVSFPQLDLTTGLLDPRVAVNRPFQVGIGFSYGL